jgi:hypothetical protein
LLESQLALRGSFADQSSALIAPTPRVPSGCVALGPGKADRHRGSGVGGVEREPQAVGRRPIRALAKLPPGLDISVRGCIGGVSDDGSNQRGWPDENPWLTGCDGLVSDLEKSRD